MSTAKLLSAISLILAANLELATIHGMPTATGKPNDRPIIAVLSQEITPGLLPPEIRGRSYIAASYVKYIESAGARAVPVTTTMTREEIEEIFNSVNGVLYPGGNAELFNSQYYTNAEHFYDLALDANRQGDFFPIWGTCLGFEALVSLTVGKPTLSSSNAIDITLPLNFSRDAKSSRMLSDASADLIGKLSREGLTYNYHHYCLTPKTFSESESLQDTYKVLSYNNDEDGKTFISTIEGKDLPFYGTQWHPEKNSFEWNEARDINHSKDAVEVTQYFADFFISQARKNMHSFSSKVLEEKYLIYRYSTVYTGDAGHFDECYIFN